MEHQAGGDVGRIDRAVRGTAAGGGSRLVEQSCGVMVSALVVRDRHDTQHFAEHPAVTPESAHGVCRPPNGCPC